MTQSRQVVGTVGDYLRAFLRDATDTTTGNIRMVTHPTPKQRRQTKIAICGYVLGIAALWVTGSFVWAFVVTALGIGGGIVLFGDR